MSANHTPPKGETTAKGGRRSYGTGSLFVKAGNSYGRWWTGDRRVKRRLGPALVTG